VIPALTGCAGAAREAHAPAAAWAYDNVEVLPEAGDLGGVTLADALSQRRSARAFTPTPLTVEQTSELLWAAQGVTSSWGGRTAPSAGALYPLEIYVVTAKSVWHYVPADHQVQVRATADARRAVVDAVGQDSAALAPALFVITGTPARLVPKYLLHAQRYTVLEAGHAAQNLLLAAAGLGLGGVPIGAFDRAAVASALGLATGEEPIYVIPVGVPDASR